MAQLPSFERLTELFCYDPLEGVLRWKIDRAQKRAGDIAGTIRDGGYVQVSVDGKLYRAHRLIWVMVKSGATPPLKIDHRNREPSSNRWLNLRSATAGENAGNAHAHCDSSTGLKNIWWNRRRGKWEVQIKRDEKKFHRRTRTLAGAVALQRLMSGIMFGEFASGA